MFMAADEFPLPLRVPLLRPRRPRRAVRRTDLDERTIVFLDCGNIDRNPIEAFKGDDAHILNIDHHHDNTRFGTVNHVVRGRVVHGRDRVGPHGARWASTPTIEIAEALYVGLVTDTGKFMYENTGPRAHVMAAELIAAGVDVHGDLPPPLRGHAVREARAARPRAGAASSASTTARSRSPTSTATTSAWPAPRRATPRASSTTCASVEGTKVAALARELLDGDGAPQEGLAALDRRRVDVSRDRPRRAAAAATASAAGFSTELSARRARRVPARAGRRAAAERLATPVDGRRPRRQAGGQDLARRRRARCAAALGVRKVGPRRHARPVRDRAAARARRPRARARSASSWRCRRPTRRSRGSARSRRPATPRARSPRPGVVPPEPLVLPTGRVRQRPPAYSAVRVGGERAYERARARRGGRDRPSARSRSTASSSCWREGDRAGFAIECSSGTYVRSLIADLGDAYCVELRRTRDRAVRRRRRRPDAGRCRSRDALRVPAARSRSTASGAARAPRRRRSPASAPDGRGGEVLLVDADGPIAIAEPREGGLLKPIVGFRAMKVTRLPDAEPRAAARRRRHVRRRPPRPPRGDRAAPTPS